MRYSQDPYTPRQTDFLSRIATSAAQANSHPQMLADLARTTGQRGEAKATATRTPRSADPFHEHQEGQDWGNEQGGDGDAGVSGGSSTTSSIRGGIGAGTTTSSGSRAQRKEWAQDRRLLHLEAFRHASHSIGPDDA